MKDKIGYVDGKGAEISANAMANNKALQNKKVKKDLEMELGRRISDTELQNFIETGEKPQPKQRIITMDPNDAAEYEKRQQAAIAKRDAMLQRRNKR
jgi:hypothetical protein